MMNRKILDQYLQQKFITQDQYDVALKIASSSHHSIDNILLACGFVTSKEIANVKSLRLDTQFVDLKKFMPQEEALGLLPRQKAIELTILPIMVQNNKLVVAIDERSDFSQQSYLEKLTGKEIQFVVASRQEILHHLMTHQYFKQTDEILEQIEELKSESLEDVDIVTLVELLIEDAIEDNASDIHISPEEDVVNVFFRIDGVLQHYHSLPKSFHEKIVSRIKVLAKLDIAQTLIPQDGQLRHNYLYHDFRLRVSSVPTSYGENLVLRLLKNNFADMNLENLGISTTNKALLVKSIHQPNGLILVTGPTGSGKTTTLYSALQEINSLSKNILTVEDPIEYEIPFVKQTQVNNKMGYTFDNALRAFMRQDPDVILVGEIRDKETANLALSASITGHLVLSTLHTTDAVGAIERLRDLGIANYLIGSGVIAIVAQRLVRKLCNKCKTKVQNPQAMLQKYNVAPTLLSKFETVEIFEPKGCKNCSYSGYSSREIVMEILKVDKHLEVMITSQKSAIEILEYAHARGMVGMLDDGYRKVLEGKTTFDEIHRVVLDREFLEE